MKNVKNTIRSQKGMTLIELLAVVVILAILALIAIPSIGGLIDNTKKDAHVANAHQMVSSARLAMATDPNIVTWTGTGDTKTGTITLADLEKGNYIENLQDPDDSKKEYNKGSDKSFVTIAKEATATTPEDNTKAGTDNEDTLTKNTAYKVVSVKLTGTERHVEGNVNSLNRDSVKKNN